MLSIRLTKTGSRKRPYFRVVVFDSARARDSRSVETLGHYQPRAKPAVVEVNRERYEYWVGKGARPSDTVRTLMAGHLTRALGAATAPAPEASAQ